jgi:hypothetical protein
VCVAGTEPSAQRPSQSRVGEDALGARLRIEPRQRPQPLDPGKPVSALPTPLRLKEVVGEHGRVPLAEAERPQEVEDPVDLTADILRADIFTEGLRPDDEEPRSGCEPSTWRPERR